MYTHTEYWQLPDTQSSSHSAVDWPLGGSTLGSALQAITLVHTMLWIGLWGVLLWAVPYRLSL